MHVQWHADTLVVRTPAKVNLFLEILKKRPDGYHELTTFMAAINLFDTLRFKEEPSRAIRLTCNDKNLPLGSENLVWRAADLIRRHSGVQKGVHIHLTKRIPIAAGLAGGSSDAAATLAGLNRFWSLELPDSDLLKMAAQLGSDVPFFLSCLPPLRRGGGGGGGSAFCTGRGEQVSPFPLKKPLHLLLAYPGAGLSTAEVYRRVEVPKHPRSPEAFRQALAAGSVEAIGKELHNRLQPAAEKLSKEVRALRPLFEKLKPIGHLMSGSGTSYFALCRSQRVAQALARQVQQQQQCPGPHQVSGLRTYVVRTLSGQQSARTG